MPTIGILAQYTPHTGTLTLWCVECPFLKNVFLVWHTQVLIQVHNEYSQRLFQTVAIYKKGNNSEWLLLEGVTDLRTHWPGGSVSSRIKIYMLYLLLCAVDSSLPRVLKNHEWSKSWWIFWLHMQCSLFMWPIQWVFHSTAHNVQTFPYVNIYADKLYIILANFSGNTVTTNSPTLYRATKPSLPSLSE